MKKLAFLSAVLLAASMVGCDNRIPMEEEQYPRSVYLVGAGETMINRDLNIGYHLCIGGGERFAFYTERCVSYRC